jgi:hypothetical protein
MSDDTGTHPMATEAETQPPERRRTILIWVIFVWACFSLISSVIGLGIYLLGMQRSGPAMGWESYALGFTGTAVFFAGALALFNLQAKAVRFLAIALGISIITSVYSLLNLRAEDFGPPPPGVADLWPNAMWSFVFIGEVGSLAIFGAMLAYVIRLRRRGVLL